MTAYLRKIFFETKEIIKSSDVVKLRDFMYTKTKRDEIMGNSLAFTPLNNPIPKEEITENVIPVEEENFEKPSTDEYITPRQFDTLFWCLYIIHHGYNDYTQIAHNYGVRELEEKQKVFEFVKKNTSFIKNTNYKLTNVAIQEILSELMTVQKVTSMNVMIAMCVYYNINILIVDANEKCMMEFWANKSQIPSMDKINEKNDAETYVLRKNKLGKYKLQMENIGASKIREMQEKYLVLESYLKPLKTISGYKVDELETIARKLGVFQENKKYKKSDLYELVSNGIQ
jgi:hypothetical protein